MQTKRNDFYRFVTRLRGEVKRGGEVSVADSLLSNQSHNNLSTPLSSPQNYSPVLCT